MKNSEIAELGHKLIKERLSEEQINYLVDVLSRKRHIQFANSLENKDLSKQRGVIIDLMLKSGYGVTDIMRMCEVTNAQVLQHKMKLELAPRVRVIREKYIQKMQERNEARGNGQ